MGVTTLLFPAGYAPELPYEWQFNIDNAGGQQALDVLKKTFAST